MKTPSAWTDESPHGDSPLEWWFVHGFFSGDSFPKQRFMVSLFRHAVPSPRRTVLPASYSLLLSLLDGGTLAQTAESWVDRTSVETAVRTFSKKGETDLDPFVVESYLDELRTKGPPRGIQVKDAGPVVRSNPLGAKWGPFSLAQNDGLFELAFDGPRSKVRCAVRLRPAQPRWEVESARRIEGPIRPMNYVSYSRLGLEGEWGGRAVAGEAWLDHQWGRANWLVEEKPSRRIFGWDWFGFNLDDGSDWVLMIHREARSGKILARHLTRRDRGGAITQSRKFRVFPLRTWESPRTGIRYPVDWRMEIPDLGAVLTFTPETDDQEIPVFGLMRAVWEGAGRVSGSVAGKEIGGRARGELQGYGFIFNFRDHLKSISRRIDRRLEEFLPREITERTLRRYVGRPVWKHHPSAYTKMLSGPVWDLVSRGGKRWRPAFPVLLLDALGVDPGPFEPMIYVLAELCHTGALIIDDIEDNSLLRRGGECLHLRYGQDLAINAANTLYFLPSLLIFDHPLLSVKQRLAIHEVMTRQYVRAHFGQALDLYWSRNMNRGNLRIWTSDSLTPKILQLYEFKTAALLEALAEAAAIIARSPSEWKSACVRFASALGVAFQIVDDVRDVTTTAWPKKSPGEDLTQGKLTYVMCRALERLEGRDRRRLEEILGTKSFREGSSGFSEGIALIQKSGAPERCQREAGRLVRRGWKPLARLLPPSESKILLRTLAWRLLDPRFDLENEGGGALWEKQAE